MWTKMFGLLYISFIFHTGTQDLTGSYQWLLSGDVTGSDERTSGALRRLKESDIRCVTTDHRFHVQWRNDLQLRQFDRDFKRCQSSTGMMTCWVGFVPIQILMSKENMQRRVESHLAIFVESDVSHGVLMSVAIMKPSSPFHSQYYNIMVHFHPAWTNLNVNLTWFLWGKADWHIKSCHRNQIFLLGVKSRGGGVSHLHLHPKYFHWFPVLSGRGVPHPSWDGVPAPCPGRGYPPGQVKMGGTPKTRYPPSWDGIPPVLGWGNAAGGKPLAVSRRRLSCYTLRSKMPLTKIVTSVSDVNIP